MIRCCVLKPGRSQLTEQGGRVAPARTWVEHAPPLLPQSPIGRHHIVFPYQVLQEIRQGGMLRRIVLCRELLTYRRIHNCNHWIGYRPKVKSEPIAQVVLLPNEMGVCFAPSARHRGQDRYHLILTMRMNTIGKLRGYLANSLEIAKDP